MRVFRGFRYPLATTCRKPPKRGVDTEGTQEQDSTVITHSSRKALRMKKLIAVLGAVILGLGITAVSATAASAHVPAITVTCQGVVLHAYAYDGDKANTWTVSIDGQVQSGTFGATLDKTIPVPQGGKTSTIGAQIADADQTPAYSQAFAGPVGPCGEVPPPPVDVCNNIDGAQATIPDGYTSDGNGGCVQLPPPPVVVTLPDASFTPATCTTGASYTLPELPDTAKYVLNSDGSRPVAGTSPLPAGQTVTVTAHTLASANVVQVSKVYGPFTGGDAIPAQSTDANAPCYVAPVVVTPPTDVTPASVVADQPVLAHTGVDAAIPLGIGGSLLVLGTVLLGIKRRQVS